MEQPQNFANHSRLHPPFHFVGFPLLLGAVILSIVLAVQTLSAGFTAHGVVESLWRIALSGGAFVALFYTRIYALKVQDRVIALEVERRYERLGGKKTSPLAEKLKPAQLVALRFASDAELVTLADRAATEGLASRAIKQAIKDWRADHRRI